MRITLLSTLLVASLFATQAHAGDGVTPANPPETNLQAAGSAASVSTQAGSAQGKSSVSEGPAAKPLVRTGTPAPASSADIARYSKREATSPNAKNYQGGDATIVIGASTLTIILAVVLLVVLL